MTFEQNDVFGKIIEIPGLHKGIDHGKLHFSCSILRGISVHNILINYYL